MQSAADTISILFVNKAGDESISVGSELSTPFAIPVTLGCRGLSQVLNHLLKEKLAVEKNFDFLIHGILLRSTIQEYIHNKGISAENVLSVEYFEAQKQPEVQEPYSHPDCMGCVCCLLELYRCACALVCVCVSACVRVRV